MKQSNTRGQAIDALVVTGRKIGAVHLVLGTVAEFSYWSRTGTPHPFLGSWAGVTIVAISAVAWLPYLMSWLYARRALDGYP